MDMKNRLRFLNTSGAHKGGLSTAFTQDLSGSINIVPPFEVQDFPKAIEQPSVKDLYRYFQGGSYAAYGSIAMISLQYKVSHAIDECRRSLAIPDRETTDNEVERLVRPTFVVNKAQRKTAKVRHTLKQKNLNDFLNNEVSFGNRKNCKGLLKKEFSYQSIGDVSTVLELDSTTKELFHKSMSDISDIDTIEEEVQ